MNKFFISSLILSSLLIFSCNSKEILPSSSISNTNLVLENTTTFKETHSLKGTGNKKLLVIPVTFKGEREFIDEDLKIINKAFFDENLSSEEDSYYSLKEYYKKSSFNKVDISGEVTDVVNVNYTVEEITKEGSYFPGVPALEYYDNKSVSDEYLRNFDLDSDGFIDSVVFVYSSKTSSRTGSFWAWVSNFDTESNINRPNFSRHMWVGLDFFKTSSYKVDAHTIIHEMGHLFNLKDYYPSDNYNLALGGHNMMDYNISDHDPYSKMLLNWTTPIYYDFKNYKEVNVKLKPFSSSNEVILLNNKWNHSVMDEYLLIEFYTPTDLNYLDSIKQYENRPLGFTKPGIKIYHVDSRISKCLYDKNNKTLSFDSYVDTIPTNYDDDVYYIIGASNSNSDSYTDSSRVGRYKQIALIENKEVNELQNGSVADDESLFYEGDKFDSRKSAYILNNKFNNKNEVNFVISVNDINTNFASINIKYVG